MPKLGHSNLGVKDLSTFDFFGTPYVHINQRASDHQLSFVSIKVDPVATAIVADYVEGSLEATGCTREQVGVVHHGDSSDADWADEEPKAGVIERS